VTYGLDIFARSMSVATTGALKKRYAHGNSWQYNPRSDRHSKILCWAIFFDLVTRKNLISAHVRSEKISFGINHTMRDFTHNRKKDLDLVICRRAETSKPVSQVQDFHSMVHAYSIVLTPSEQSILSSLPTIPLTTVQTALVAIEAKAAMTELGKAQPRIYDELNSSHATIHGDTDSTIAAGFAIVNMADTFISPVRNSWNISSGLLPPVINSHKQPKDAVGMIAKIEQLPRRSALGTAGFDALGLALIECQNNGSSVELVRSYPSPQPGDLLYYDNFIERIETIYSARFSGL
jgi:hypothetical protein